MTSVNVYRIDGSTLEKIELPDIFHTEYRPDLIKKAFNVLHSNKRQPYGADPYAGTKHATASVGKGRGSSRVPRLTQGRTAALAPCVVGGRRAHPPKSEKNWKEKINKKERILSIHSALAATSDRKIVSNRGHKFNDKISLPIVIEDKLSDTIKTKDLIKIFKSIGIHDDVIRAENGKHIRAGRGKSRGRRYKTPKSILIVSTKDNIKKSSNNLTGVDVIKPENINIENLAPGGDAGRLMLITKTALMHFRGGS
jgi:large subunit ribosomal protein L4e